MQDEQSVRSAESNQDEVALMDGEVDRRCTGKAQREGPTVSVVMGVFNAERYVSTAIESILGQSFADFEFLIIDDGSSDATLRIVREYASRDVRIRVIAHDHNRGLGHVLNEGVQKARGEYVARMDADDISIPIRLERMVAHLRDNPDVDIVGSYAAEIDDEGQERELRRVPLGHEKIVELIWMCPIIHPTVMFRRRRILEVGSYSPTVRRRQDYELWFRCAHAGLRFENIPEPLLLYRYCSETMKRNHMRSMWDQAWVGIRGCRLVGAPPLAYVGVLIPFAESMFPRSVRQRLIEFRKRLDPRRSA